MDRLGTDRLPHHAIEGRSSLGWFANEKAHLSRPWQREGELELANHAAPDAGVEEKLHEPVFCRAGSTLSCPTSRCA